jgi:D-alanyl-D-alanine carboxypeptidase (penicillin-binding protein 5/6)
MNFNTNFDTSTEAIALKNLNTNTTVFQKNIDKKMYPASITKIMTYIIVAENAKDFENTLITVSGNLLKSLQGTDSSTAKIKAGEVFTVKKLLECLMIASGNDAAVVLADYFGGSSVSTFVEKMNEKAKVLGCENTNFCNPHGLHDDDHYTTANDVLKITQFALNVPFFSEIISKTEVYVRDTDRMPIATTNIFIDKVRGGLSSYSHAVGGKSGYTFEAGRCLVTISEKNNQKYMCAALGDFSEGGKLVITDTKNLFEWAFNNLSVKLIVDKKSPMGETNLKYATTDHIHFVAAEDLECVLPKNVDPSSVQIDFKVSEYVEAPVAAGTKIGEAFFSYANQHINKVDIVAMETIEQNKFIYIITNLKKFFSSPVFLITFSIFSIVLAAYICLVVFYNKKNRRSKRSRYRRYKKY